MQRMKLLLLMWALICILAVLMAARTGHAVTLSYACDCCDAGGACGSVACSTCPGAASQAITAFGGRHPPVPDC